MMKAGSSIFSGGVSTVRRAHPSMASTEAPEPVPSTEAPEPAEPVGGVARTPERSRNASRRSSKEIPELDENAKAVRQTIQKLAQQARDAEEHRARLERMDKYFSDKQDKGNPVTPRAKEKNRRHSKDLTEQIAALQNANLERVFHQFDTDGSGALDAEELSQAYQAAGMAISDDNLRKTIKMLDTNGDGEIDLGVRAARISPAPSSLACGLSPAAHALAPLWRGRSSRLLRSRPP